VCTQNRVVTHVAKAIPAWHSPGVGKRAQLSSEPTAYAGLGHFIPSRDEGEKLLREMCCARQESAGGDARARARFEHLRNRVCTGHLRFALVLSKRYLRRRGRLDLEDLLQLAALGLMRACESFEPERGVAFCTYSANWVRHYVGRGIADSSRIIRAPVHLQEARGRFNRAAAKSAAATGRAPGVEDLAALTGLSPAIVARAVAPTGDVSSLDVALFEGGGETVGDTVAGAGPSPLDAVLAKERAEHARASLAALPEREREVIRLRSADPELTLKELGTTLVVERTGRVGLSRERVRQIEQNALSMLRRQADKGLRLDS